MRVRPPASVSEWLLSVAEVLPLPYRSKLPYTLGSAIIELGEYAEAVGSEKWNERASRTHRSSLGSEIEFQTSRLGPRLAKMVGPRLEALRNGLEAQTVAVLANGFAELWHSTAAIEAAFRDLCDAAKARGVTSRKLRGLSAIIASQVGAAAESPFSPLREAASWLSDSEVDLFRGARSEESAALSEHDRVTKAEDILSVVRTGHVTVWLTFYRAIVDSMRTVAGPMTFLRADWALPNALDNGPNSFPECAELKQLQVDVHWLEELHDESLKIENRLALVRVDLGDRRLAGAVEDARRRVEAILSVAVEAGGVSWQSASAYAVLVDGKVHSSSIGLDLGNHSVPGDEYGIGATAEILTSVAEQLGEALEREPMPEALMEALSALREARLTDHRDVLFFGVRPITPRVATALEDHALELIASLLGVKATSLSGALQTEAALGDVDDHVAAQLMASFEGGWQREDAKQRRELEEQLVTHAHGRRVISVGRVISQADQIRSLPMTDLQRADFEDAFAICTEPSREAELLREVLRESSILRARLRRVRNAVNHGLPLSTTALHSVRGYAEKTSTTALNLALTWYKAGGKGSELVQRSDQDWSARTSRVATGVSWADHDAAHDEPL